MGQQWEIELERGLVLGIREYFLDLNRIMIVMTSNIIQKDNFDSIDSQRDKVVGVSSERRTKKE